MSTIPPKSTRRIGRMLAGVVFLAAGTPPVVAQNAPVDISQTYQRVRDAVFTLTVKYSPGTAEQKLGAETRELVDFLDEFNGILSQESQNGFQRISVVDFWETWYQRFNSIHNSFIRALASRNGDGSYRSIAVAVREDGLILSNNASVFSGTNVVAIEAYGEDQVVYNATVRAQDPITNLALIQVHGARFEHVVSITPPARLLPPGSPIFSIQHCYTHKQTTPVPGTMGNSGISGYGYQLNMERALHEEYFQAIMPLYHDSEGAPIFDLEGNLLGLLALEYRVAHYPGVVFAVPSWMIADVATDLINYGRRERGALGITIDKSSLRVTEVLEGKAAASAGIQPGDVIESFNGSPIRNLVQLYIQIFRTRPYQIVPIGVRRGNQRYLIEVEMDRFVPSSEG